MSLEDLAGHQVGATQHVAGCHLDSLPFQRTQVGSIDVIGTSEVITGDGAVLELKNPRIHELASAGPHDDVL